MKKVLVVVDYQRDFVNGALGFDSASSLDEGIANLITEFIRDGGIVICTYDTHRDNYLDTQEGKKLPVKHCIKNTDGWALYGKVGELISGLCTDVELLGNNKECRIAFVNMEPKCVRGKVFLVQKPTFGSTTLADTLLKIESMHDGIESITLVGVVTNMCVISNAVIAKAACPEAEIIIKKDLVDSFDHELHDKALDVMRSMQMTIE